MTTDLATRPGWTVTTFRRVARVSGGLVDPTDPKYSSMRLIAPNHIESGTGVLLGDESADEQGADSGKYLANKGDILYSKIRPQLNKVTIAPEPCLCSADMYPVRLNSGDVRFAVYWMLAKPFLTFASTMADRVKMPKINRDELAGAPWVTPPAPEQRAIADFLDRETAKIDALIEKQGKLVELLRERSAIAIRQVLTNGLQLNASRRASDIPLIDSLPSHWTTVPLRHLCSITTGSEDSGNADPDGRYPFYVRGREILRIGSYGFDGEAVLTPGDGQGGTGKVFHYALGKFQAHQRVYVFNCFRGVLGRYVYYWLSTFLKAIALAGSNTVTMESLRRPLLASIPVAVPPWSEQQGIVSRLDHEAAITAALTAKSEELVALARERRAALITAAVTGQLEVLGEAD